MASNEIVLNFFHLVNSPVLISGNLIYINLYYFLKNKKPLSIIDNQISNYSNLTYNKTNTALYHGFIDYINTGLRLKHDEIILLRSYIADCFLKFNTLNTTDGFPSPVVEYSHETIHATRYGNVELRVIENYLYDRDALILTAREVSREIYSGQFSLRNQIKDTDRWFTGSDIRFNLQALMTNAGFIVHKNQDIAEKEILEWCSLYFEEIGATSNFIYPGAYPFFLGTLQKIFDNSFNKFENIKFPNTFKFYEILAGRKILFLTPFAKLIEDNFNKGNIFNLYKDKVLPRFELITIDAPLSLYPSRPYDGWGDAHNAICKRIDEIIIKNKIDFFIASAGSYGLPLCNYVRKNHSIRTLYFGNHLNTLFGILQQCSTNFMDGYRQDNFWVKGDLSERCPQITEIDNGRYI